MADDPIWLVCVTVIDLVPASSAEEATQKLKDRCQDRGLDIYDFNDEDTWVDESDPLEPEDEARTREDWGPFAPRWVEQKRFDPLR
jgi:hypothetical protein